MAINYSGNKKYFKPLVWKPTAIIGAIGLAACAANPLLGVIIIAVAAAIIAVQVIGKSSAASIDQQCRETVAGIKEKALKKLGLDEDQVTEIAPVIFDGYKFVERWNPYYKEEGSGKWRSSNYEASVFFFSAEQVYYYAYFFSLTEDSKTESTEEYFYKDIVSAATATDTFKFPDAGKGKSGKDKTIQYEFFKLTTSGGTSISASVQDMESAARSINGMKQLLRQKKSAD